MFVMRFYQDINFLYTLAPNVITDKILLDHIRAHNKLFSDKCIKELADIREIENLSQLSVEGTVNAAREAVIMPKTLLAIVSNGQSLNYALARAFEMFIEDKRDNVKLFTDINEAENWLNVNTKAIGII